MAGSTSQLGQALRDRYAIERELGHGGMATVYLAHDLRHKRPVALKVLRPELAALIGAERFLAEIQTTANLQHPHILPLFDSGEVGGLLYYVMPYVSGESLRARLNREVQLPIAEALRLTREIGSALDYAHRQGVIHRDVKPENILLQDGTALVADFGIALAVSNADGTRLTQTGLSLGTPSYMSPEQAAGDHSVDARSDVYALGAVGYEMLTGQPPFVAASTQVLIAKLMTETPAPPSASRKTVTPEMDAAILAALEKLPADRPATPAAFVAQLESRAPTARNVGQRSVSPARISYRHPSPWLAFAAGVLLGILGTAWWLPQRSANQSDQRGQVTFTGRARTPAISPDGKFIAYVDQTCKQAQLGLCRSALLVQETGTNQPVTLLTGALALDQLRWSHDGATLLFAGRLDSARSGIFATPRLGGSPRLVASLAPFDTHPAGDTIVVVQPRGDSSAVARIIRLQDGGIVDSVTLPFGGVVGVAWRPGGRYLAFAGDETGIRVATRQGKLTSFTHVGNRPQVRWSETGDAVLVFSYGVGREDELMRVGIDRAGRSSGAPQVALARVPTLYRGEFDIARRSGRLVLATGSSTVDVWTFNLQRGVMAGRPATHGSTWYSRPALAPDGQTLFYLRGDALGDNVYQLRMGTGIEEPLTSQRFPGASVLASADGRRLVYAHGVGGAKRLEEMELPSRRAVSRDSAPFGPGAAPIGTRGLVGITADSGLALLDSITAPVWRPLTSTDSLSVLYFAPAPDGRQVAFIGSVRHDRHVLGIVSVASREIRLLRPLDDEPILGRLSWDSDGRIYLARWLPGNQMPSLWHVRETGELELAATLPAPCNPASVSVAAHGRAAVCLVEDNRSDIWTVERAGAAR